MDSKLEEAAKKLLEEILTVEYGGVKAREAVEKDFSACLVSTLTLLQEQAEFSKRNVSKEVPELKWRTTVNVNRLIQNILKERRLNEAREILSEETHALSAK